LELRNEDIAAVIIKPPGMGLENYIKCRIFTLKQSTLLTAL